MDDVSQRLSEATARLGSLHRCHGSAGDNQLLDPQQAAQSNGHGSAGGFGLDLRCTPDGHTIVVRGLIRRAGAGRRAAPANCREVGFTASTAHRHDTQRNLAALLVDVFPCLRCQHNIHGYSPVRKALRVIGENAVASRGKIVGSISDS